MIKIEMFFKHKNQLETMEKYVVVSRNYKYGEVECKIYDEDKMIDIIKTELIRNNHSIMCMYKKYPPSIGIEKMCHRLNSILNDQVNIKKIITFMLALGNDLYKYQFGWGWYSVVRLTDGKQWL